MTYHHVIVIVVGIVALAYCAHTPSCQAVMPQLATVVGTTIGGAFGHANAATRNRAKKKQPRGSDAG